MERKDVERVEKELDEILQIMEPASFLQGSGTEKLTGEQMENTREELAVSRRPETEGQNKISGDGRGGRPPRRSGGKSIRIPENGRKETEREKEAEKETGKESGAAEAWLDEDFGDGGDFEEIAEEIQEELEIRRDGFEERQREDSGGRFTSTGEFLRLLKPTDAYLAAFFVPIIVMVIIFAQRGIFPFGEESFLRTDMYHQYAPFFSEFQYKLTQGGSLLYSWDVGMGVNFSALYAYYLASPFNWLLVLCPKDMIIEFMSYGIVLKIGLAGLSFTWYLKRHCKTRDFGAGFFGIFYALSGYVAAYSWNIMWLDCIILLPLILLGLERLVKGGKPYLYCLALGASILSNYYISIMICLFLVLYMAALLILEPPKGVKAFFGACGKFAVFSLAAGGLAAVVLLPEIYALKSTASGNFDFPDTVTSYFSIFDMLARHLVNVQTEQGLDHWPNLYCGTAALIFFLLFLVCKKIRLREKIVYGSLLFLFLASFAINVLNFTWHGFHYPNSLPCRQSFIYIALMLLVCYRAYMYLGETPLKHVGMAFMGASVFVLLAQKMVDNTEQFHFSVYYVSLLLLAAYSGLIYLYRTVRRGKELVLLTALALVSVESAVNTTVTSVPTTSRTAYTDDNQDVEALLAELEPTTFYRVEKVDRKTKNDGARMNFPSVSLFSSTADASLSTFLRLLGCETSTNAYSITGSTPLVDSLFSVRYALYDQEQATGEGLEFLGHRGSTWLYENQFTLPVAFMLPADIEDNWILDYGNPAYVQNDLCSLLGVSPVLVEENTDSQGGKISFTPQETGDYYVYVTDRQIEKVTVYAGESSRTFDNVSRGYFLELGNCPDGQEITLENGDGTNRALEAQVWRFDMDALRQVYEKLNQNPMTVTRWTDVGIEGIITADQAGTMFTSIPFDEGWSLLIDGNEQKPREIFDTFLAVDVTAGTHTIELSYEPRGLRAGGIITAASVIFVGITAAAEAYMTRRKTEEEA